MCIKYGVDHKYIERAAPWRNGRAERTVRTVKRMLKAVLTAREADDWPGLLPQIQLAINSAPYKATGMTPFELFYGEKAPPMIRPHELSGELMSLTRPIDLQKVD